MEKLVKKDLGDVKETKREKNGVTQTIRLFTNKQRQIIMDEVNNRPDGVTIEEVLDLYEVSPAVYYTWVRNENKKKKKENKSDVPNPLLESSVAKNFSSESHLREFYLKNSKELNEFIEKKYKEWAEKDTIAQIASKVNDKNIKDVARAGGVTVDELKSFLNRKNLNLSFFAVESIKRYIENLTK